METNTGKQEVVRIIQNLSGKHSPYVIFYDFCKMFSISIANACKMRHDDIWQKREDAYVEVAKKYTKEEMVQFIELKEHLIEAFEEKMGDVLGEIYMESGAGNKSTGQFFTPFHVSEAVAALVVPEVVTEETPYRMHEPSSGSGGMIVAAAKIIRDRDLNYQKCMKVVAQDLDWLAVYMCYIQLSMYGIDAIVVQGDSLCDPYHKGYPEERVFRTPRNAGALIAM